MRFAEKVAIVTGSSRGVGLSIARRIVSEGGSVMLTGRDRVAGEAAVAELAGFAGEARFQAADLAVDDAPSALVARTRETFGRLDLLVNNAAPTDLITARDSTVEAIDAADWRGIVEGAATLALRMCQAAIPALRAAGGGAIVNISTSVATRGVHGMTAHSASKAAIEALTRSLAVELGGDAIRANTLVLGFIVSGPRQAAVADSPRGALIQSMQALARFGDGDDVAAAAAFLASDEARFITGATLHLDGGTSSRMPLALPK
ncbi:SDR family NAD(P)-dependent oxidoreductase [Novosphingobium sp. BL-52-GroH]|uniref:SDR family NAD(P)-dependent oxidoreductase n=1 Tax=Novosphingobium sp. BL-52-GroH TaxID=3349877 RepID=UPI003851444D